MTQGFTLGWTAAPILVDNTLVVFTPSDPVRRMLGCRDITTIQCVDLDFQATLTSVGPVQSGAADMTSTFTFTAQPWIYWINGTVVECSGTTSPPTPSESRTFTAVGK